MRLLWVKYVKNIQHNFHTDHFAFSTFFLENEKQIGNELKCLKTGLIIVLDLLRSDY